jgi:uncharacterized protein
MTRNAHISALTTELFGSAGANAIAAARQLRTRLAEHPDSSVDHPTIKALEQAGDEITRQIVHALLDHDDAPADRQELYGLASAVDDVVDHVEHVSDLLDLYGVEAAMQQAIDQCDVLVRASTLLAEALARIGSPAGTEELLAQIKQAEDEGDQLERRAIAALFEHEEISPRTIIQWKDIFEGLEAAIDACERAALVIGNMMFKAR